MSDDTNPAATVRELAAAWAYAKCSPETEVSGERGYLAGYTRASEEHDAYTECIIHEHNEAMNNTIRMYEAKLAQAIVERDEALREHAQITKYYAASCEERDSLKREVERLRSALARIEESAPRVSEDATNVKHFVCTIAREALKAPSRPDR